MRWPFAVQRDLTLGLPEISPSRSTRFAFSLFRQLRTEPETRNLFFSPASVMLCLCLLYEGATGETRERMEKILEVGGLSPEALQSAIVALNSVLRIKGPGLRLEAAHSIWYNPKWNPRSEYLAKIRKSRLTPMARKWLLGSTLGSLQKLMARSKA
jgi:serine protease inhibitor